MNVRNFLIISVVVTLCTSQILLGETSRSTAKGPAFSGLSSDTLKYDVGKFDDGLAWFTTSGQTDPHEDSTWGTATYFVLSEFDVTKPAKLMSVSLCWYGFAKPEHNFRLYVWSNNGPALEPKSQGPHLYRDLEAEIHNVQYEFKEFDLSSQNIELPDTFWIGVCGNHFGTDAANADWSLAFDKGTDDNHTLCNDMDDTKEWFPASELSMAKAFGVRVLVEDNVGISNRRLLSYDRKSFAVSQLSKGHTTVRFTLVKDTKVSLALYDVNGRNHTTLITDNYPRGTYTKSFLLNVVPGIYMMSFMTDYGKKVCQKVSFVR